MFVSLDTCLIDRLSTRQSQIRFSWRMQLRGLGVVHVRVLAGLLGLPHGLRILGFSELPRFFSLRRSYTPRRRIWASLSPRFFAHGWLFRKVVKVQRWTTISERIDLEAQAPVAGDGEDFANLLALASGL